MKKLTDILEKQPKYRIKQIHYAWFDPSLNNYKDISTLPKVLRDELKELPWISTELAILQESKKDNTKKALLKLEDGSMIETVLMGRENREEVNRYTICISSQVGCAMQCAFCATGKLGYKRNLTYQEIIDQVRFWKKYLQENIGEGSRISNIVFMGQGEPLMNYENVKQAIQILLNNTDIGKTHIIVSTVGVIPGMKRIIEDADFPSVRFALSLHSAVEETRNKLIPSHRESFFDFLIDWSEQYHEKFPSRSHFIGIEYIMMRDLNDDNKHLKAFIKLISKIGSTRINLIPYNSTCGDPFQGSRQDTIEKWQQKLMDSGFICTIRKSQGQDIAAACGQLASEEKK